MFWIALVSSSSFDFIWNSSFFKDLFFFARSEFCFCRELFTSSVVFDRKGLFGQVVGFWLGLDGVLSVPLDVRERWKMMFVG